jgi:hypothetical protein
VVSIHAGTGHGGHYSRFMRVKPTLRWPEPPFSALF